MRHLIRAASLALSSVTLITLVGAGFGLCFLSGFLLGALAIPGIVVFCAAVGVVAFTPTESVS